MNTIKNPQYRHPTVGLLRENLVEAINALSNLGMVYTNLGPLDSAFYFFDQAYEQVGKGWNENVWLQSSSEMFTEFAKVSYLIPLLLGKASAFVKQYKFTNNPSDVKEALKFHFVSDKILFRLKTEQSDQESKLFWRKDTRVVYMKMPLMPPGC